MTWLYFVEYRDKGKDKTKLVDTYNQALKFAKHKANAHIHRMNDKGVIERYEF